MIDSRTQHLRTRPGEPLTAEKWNGLLDVIDQASRAVPGPGLLVRNLPSGRIFTAAPRRVGGGGGVGDHPFRAAITPGDAPTQLKASFTLGTLAGVVPRIGPAADAKPISDASVPTFQFDTARCVDAATGLGALYWHIVFNTDWSVVRLYPEALSRPPLSADFTSWKLIGFLIRNPATPKAVPAWKQMSFHNLNHAATQRHGGRALHRYFAV